MLALALKNYKPGESPISALKLAYNRNLTSVIQVVLDDAVHLDVDRFVASRSGLIKSCRFQLREALPELCVRSA